MAIAALLFVNALITASCFLVLWFVARAVKDVSFVDSWWAFGLVLTAFVSYMNSKPGSPHALLIFSLCALWGLRLGSHLLLRWLHHGADRRYTALLGQAQAKRGWSFSKAAFRMVFVPQALLQFIVSLPVQIGAMSDRIELQLLAYGGGLMAFSGIVFEAIADWQLLRFKASADNRTRVMDQGLWRFTRHPNYFGDALTWWGLFFVAADTGAGLWSFPGPLLLTYLLVKVSGIPTVESYLQKSRLDYADYARRTSAFLPWPPSAR